MFLKDIKTIINLHKLDFLLEIWYNIIINRPSSGLINEQMVIARIITWREKHANPGEYFYLGSAGAGQTEIYCHAPGAASEMECIARRRYCEDRLARRSDQQNRAL